MEVVKKKEKKKIPWPPLGFEPRSAGSRGNTLDISSGLSIAARSINTWVFFLGKCVRTTTKTMLVDRKNQNGLALIYLASGPLPSAANSSDVPTVCSRTQQR